MRIKYRDVSFASVAVVFGGGPEALLLKHIIRERGVVAALVDALAYYEDAKNEFADYNKTCAYLMALIRRWPAEAEENRASIDYPAPKQFIEG